MARHELYKNQRHLFVVSEDGDRLVLEVVCGGHGMYLKEHWLTEDEASQFRTDPESMSAVARELCLEDRRQ